MAGLSDALGTATRGLQTVQNGIATTGHNIANVDTPGFSRQRSIVQTGVPQTDATGTIGTGSEQVSVERIVDRFVNSRLVSETSRSASLETEASIYREVEVIVNDQLTAGLSDDVANLFSALDSLASSDVPGQPIERAQLAAAGEALADTLHRYDDQLRSLQRGADESITSILPSINGLTSRIAQLNREISESETIAPANDLRDRRDQLVLELAEKLEITTLEDDQGMLSVRVSGGLSLVDRDIANELVAVVDPGDLNEFDPTFSKVYYQGSGGSFDATSLIRGGELGGMLEARDGIIGGTIRDLDAFAFTLAEAFNAEHRTGLGLADGNPHDFFADLTGQTSVNDSARNFGLSADIDVSQGGTLDNIAAGSVPDPVTGGPAAAAGDTSGLEGLKDLRNLRIPQYLAGDLPGAATGSSATISGSLSSLVGGIGQRAEGATRSLAQQESVVASLQARRDSVSGVSIDEEVAQLVQLQTHFQANTRVISTVRTLFQDLLDAI